MVSQYSKYPSARTNISVPVAGFCAVPVPVPAPVAVNVIPGVFDIAPIAVKSVVPTVIMVYLTPRPKLPAVVGKKVTSLVKALNV